MGHCSLLRDTARTARARYGLAMVRMDTSRALSARSVALVGRFIHAFDYGASLLLMLYIINHNKSAISCSLMLCYNITIQLPSIQDGQVIGRDRLHNLVVLLVSVRLSTKKINIRLVCRCPSSDHNAGGTASSSDSKTIGRDTGTISMAMQ